MSDITSEKLAGIEPTWRRYAGVSVLYDNPGTVRSCGLERIDELPAVRDAGQELYDALADVTAELHEGSLRGLGLCALPRSTYHVTVCDGVNQTEVDRVSPAQRPVVQALLDGLPDSLLRRSLPSHILGASDLLPTVWANPVTLRVRDLWIGGHVLAAGLEPADERSDRALAAHRAARDRLVAQLESVLGVPTQAWRPHVSLGYFGNRTGADAAGDALADDGTRLLASRTDDLHLTFRSAAVHGFVDMVSYWRVGR